MTIVMEEDGFNTSLSSLSSLSSQPNYQTLTSSGNNSTRNTIFQSQQSNSPPSSNNQEINGPYALFLFRSSSSLELFEERKINLDKPCKIGRSVAKIKPEPHNAIFDCKVLSRNHALLWHENSKFFIQDTKSSNGTFLNGNRLGKSNEDSAPYDLTSGDIIQFGVDVTENTKKVTHGCITVEIKLFHKPGIEASAFKPNQVTQSNKIDVQTQELYQLALFLQEAMMREEVLNQKLISLQAFLDQAKETSENGWLTLIDEDRLLSRIDLLEKQASLYTKNHTEDSLKATIANLTKEKFNIESTAKLAIQKMIEDMNEALLKHDELKAVYNIREEEFVQQQRVLEESKSSLLELAGKYQEALNELSELQEAQKGAQDKFQEITNELNSEKEKYEILIEESSHIEKTLNAKIESLIAEKDFTSKRLEGVLNKIEKNNIILSNEPERIQVNGSTTGDIDEVKDENFKIKSEKITNGLPETNGLHHDDENEEIEVKLDEVMKSSEYYQQELELQKIINDNLLAEIQRLKNVLSSPNKDSYNRSFGSESSPTPPREIKQQSENFSTDVKETGDDTANSNNSMDLKNEISSIKNKIFQIESQAKDILKNGEFSGELNDNLLNYVNSIDQSFRRIYEINGSSLNLDTSNQILKNEESNDQSQQYLQLQEKYNEMETSFKCIEKQLVDSEKTVDKLSSEFKDVSLQVKIVSYFSAFPLLILILAIMVSFYPILATITATSV